MQKFDSYCDTINIDKIIESIEKISQYKGMLGEDWEKVQMHVKFRFNEIINTNPQPEILDALYYACDIVDIQYPKNTIKSL